MGEGISPIWALAAAVVTGILTYITSKTKSDSTVEIAKIKLNHDSGEKEALELREELADMRDAFLLITKKYEACQAGSVVNSKTLTDYRNLLRHYQFIFKLVYKQIVPHLDKSDVSYGLMEEVKEMFRDDFKL